MKRTILLFCILVLAFTACSGDSDPDRTDSAPDSVPALESVDIVPEPDNDELPQTLPDSTSTPDPYDGLAPTRAPEGYPIETGSEVEADLPPYPATGTIWIIRPLGLQCTESSDYEYKTIQEAQLALNDAGIIVYKAEKTLLGTCEACDCPVSEHYRMRIDELNLAAAQALGWESEE